MMTVRSDCAGACIVELRRAAFESAGGLVSAKEPLSRLGKALGLLLTPLIKYQWGIQTINFRGKGTWFVKFT